MSEKYETEQNKVLSRPYGINVNQASKIVRQMVKEKYHLSSAHYNSMYFYTHDKVCVAAVSERHDDNNKSDSYSGELLHINSMLSFNISKDIYNDIILTLAHRQEGVCQSKPEKITFADFKHYYESKQHLGGDGFIQSVLYLIENNCPMNFVNRSYYFFDNNQNHPDKEHPGIWELNHENKLVKYDIANKPQWFLTSDFGSRSFSKLTKRSEQLFDFVEKAYAKQK
jgi:hypothetical protein